MTFQYRARISLTTALAVASLASAAPAGADPNPAQRVQTSPRASAASQAQYYLSHKPAIPARGHEFLAIDAREAPGAPGGEVMVEADGAGGFEWGDAAIGAGAALGLAAVFAGGAVVLTRRDRVATG